MNYLLKPYLYTTSMYSATISSADWLNLLQHPVIIADKSEAPLAIYGTMARNVQLDEKRNPHCIANNIDSIYALQIDYDDGFTIDEFSQKYAEYRWTLYTSHSYGYKENDRFRVIFPLPEQIQVSTFSPVLKSELVRQFPGVDESCFDSAHWQILPCIRKAGAPYIFRQNSGRLYDHLTQSFATDCFNKWQASKTAHNIDMAARKSSYGDLDMDDRRKDAALRKAQEIIDNAVQGSRNRTLWSVLCWLKNTCELDAEECSNLDVPNDMSREYESMLSRIW